MCVGVVWFCVARRCTSAKKQTPPKPRATDIGLTRISFEARIFQYWWVGRAAPGPPIWVKTRSSTENPVQPDVSGTVVWVGLGFSECNPCYVLLCPMINKIIVPSRPQI